MVYYDKSLKQTIMLPNGQVTRRLIKTNGLRTFTEIKGVEVPVLPVANRFFNWLASSDIGMGVDWFDCDDNLLSIGISPDGAEIEPLRYILAMIQLRTDIGTSSWYEVIYHDGENWQSFHDSKTFDGGETIAGWVYADLAMSLGKK